MSEWVNVKDKFPPDGELVLCAGQNGGMFLGIGRNCMLYSNGTCFMMVPNAKARNMMYWMPLPEPPEAKK